MPARLFRCARIGLILMSANLLTALAGPIGRVEAGFSTGNLGLNNSFSSTTGFNLTGPQIFTGQGFGIAVEFKVASPVAVSFDSAQLGLSYLGGTNALDVSLMTNLGGVPSGLALETIHLSGIAAGPHLVTVTSTTHSVLTAGVSYWLVANYGAANTAIIWLANTTNQTGNAAYRPDTTAGMGTWVRDSVDSDPSFAIFGTFLNPTGMGAVDAPPSGILLGIGGLGLASGHFLRRRRV